ncbi:unnamed protein product [Mytilus edulis]|uniref:C1q domain-containing protein n=1 Tax=Mytilus edulis TaxID=6550 RepID=A0A8S3Q1Z8_MYTED|nr:unnamed protein product [Mytilus edulis]
MGHVTFCKSIQNVTYINEGTLESRIERIERFIEALEDKRKKPPVLFYAVIVKRAFTLNKHSTIVFETVIINEGDHYNKNDGVFVAPQNGIYMFSWTVATVNVHYIVTELVVEDEVVTTTGEKEIDSGSLTSASMTVFYRMKRDEHAWIRTNNWGTENFVHSTGNYPQSSFLGILIHAE